MKRKKQLLSWILSFLMVFSIMPMVSISALEATYDMNNIHVGSKLYPGDVIQDSNNNGIMIIYFKDPLDAHNGVSSKDITTEAGKDATILSLEAPSGYVLGGYIVNDIFGSSDIIMTYRLIAEWKKVHKIAYDMTNITVSEIDVDGEEYDIDGQTSVTSGSSVTITISADTGYTLPDAVTVEMGGTVLNNPAYEYDQATGKVRGLNVTADVKITALGVEEETPPTPSVTAAPAISSGQVSSIGKTSAILKSSREITGITLIKK